MDPEPTAAADEGATPAAPAAGHDQPKASASKPVTIKQRMSALLSDKTKLTQERDAANERAETAEALVLAAEHDREEATTTLTNELLTAAGATIQNGETAAEAISRRVSELDTARATAEARVEELQGEAKTADELADEKVASAGFPANKLPAASEKAAGETRADLESQLKDADPKQRVILVRKLNAMKTTPGVN